MEKKIGLVLFSCFIIAHANSEDFTTHRKIRALRLEDQKREEAIEKDSEKQEYLCISLGFNCITALNLDRNKLRSRSFPFDWNITSLYGLCDILNNDFLDFLNPSYLDRRAGIFNAKYNMAFAHDFPVILQADGTHTEVANYLDFLEEIETKYQRRIKRFNNACNAAKTVYFFRLATANWKFDTVTQDQASIITLRDALMKKFPTNNWILVAIGTWAHYKQDWQIPNVQNFYLSAHGMNKEWTTIFQNLGLIKS